LRVAWGTWGKGQGKFAFCPTVFRFLKGAILETSHFYSLSGVCSSRVRDVFLLSIRDFLRTDPIRGAGN
jgi:hypothetical protein